MEEGDLKTSVDFGRVYAPIHSNWLRIDPQPVLAGEFPTLVVIAG
jgi:hypothetical protein